MITCVPAYGRDYKSAQAVIDDWLAGKDFKIQDVSCRWNGRYINKIEATRDKEVVTIRYSKLTKAVEIGITQLREVA